jgi:N,N'-diacetylchitobiose transport system permease protein
LTPVAGRRKAQPFPYALLAPALAVLLVLVGYPVARMLVTSFQKFGRAQAFGAAPEWVGLTNYVKVLTSADFYRVLGRSFAFMLVAVSLTIVLGTLVALLMMRLNKGFRVLVSIGLLLAWAMPALTSVIVWGWMFDTQFGVINFVLTKVTGDDWAGHSWLSNPLSFFAVLTFVIVWQGIPFVAFTLYAGLTQVDGAILESAQIDGASAVRRFFQVQMPMTRSIFTVLIVLSIIWDLRVFSQVYALQGIGGIAEKTSTLGVWIYQRGSSSGDFGLSAAAAVVMCVIMLVISFYYVRQTLTEED